jgi:hypothetical protein
VALDAGLEGLLHRHGLKPDPVLNAGLDSRAANSRFLSFPSGRVGMTKIIKRKGLCGAFLSTEDLAVRA